MTNLGLPKIVYEEAVKQSVRTVGYACSKAKEYECFPTDEEYIVGKEWGDESEAFLNDIDELIKIGGGEQSEKEFESFFKT